jgi:tetratricopeptide (TPR) repeat protein
MHSDGGSYEFSVSALNQKQYGASEPTGREVVDAPALWLGKGQAMLNLGLARDAVECFEKAVVLNPDCAPDAYVKRGMALEQLQQLEAAIESYDRALAAEPTLTLAYLYKGAACNRLQRYREALDCYDQALRCEQRVTDSGQL